MLKISAEKINELFDKIASKQTLYIPVDREDKQAEYKKYESGMTLSKLQNLLQRFDSASHLKKVLYNMLWGTFRFFTPEFTPEIHS